MANWNILKSSRNDFLSSLATINNNDSSLNQLHMMSSFIDQTFSSPIIYNENSFCTLDNIDECIAHLNQDLTGLGLKSISRDGIHCTTSLINTLDEIVHMYQRSGRIKEELENRLHRTNCDVTENQAVIRRLKFEKDAIEKELAREKEKSTQAHGKIKTLSKKLKTEKDELCKAQAVIKDRDIQYRHELKKQQREINKLTERLHQLLIDKNPDRKIGIDMIGLLHRADGKRSTWNTSSGNSSKQEEMYQALISNYEEKHQELRVENSDLRDCLLDMQKQLATLLDISDASTLNVNAKNGEHKVLSACSSEEDLSTTSSASHDLTDDYFQMPYDVLKENLKKNVHSVCKRLRHSLQCSQNSRSSANSATCHLTPLKSTAGSHEDGHNSKRRQEELTKLQNQIEKYKEIVKQQELLIQQSLCSQSKSVEKTFLHESQILQEKESLSEQRRKFYQDKANFEEEKRKISESARQIQQERKQLDAMKINLLRCQFLEMSPYDSKASTPSSKADKSRLLPSTPVFSPTPGKSKAKSVTELMKILRASKKKKSPSKDRIISGTQIISELEGDLSQSKSCDLIQCSSVSSKRLSVDNVDISSGSSKVLFEDIDHVDNDGN